MRATAILMCVFLFISVVGAGAQTFKTLHSFTNGHDDQNRFPGVILDKARNLYGVTAWGQESEGTIFQLTPTQGGWQIIPTAFDREAGWVCLGTYCSHTSSAERSRHPGVSKPGCRMRA